VEIEQNPNNAPNTNFPSKSSVKEIVRWWEKKRLIYNGVIIGFSVFLMYSFWDYPMRSIIGTYQVIWNAIVYIIIANLFYTSSWGLELFRIYVLKTNGLSNNSKWVIFVLGALFSLLCTNINFVLEFDVLFAD
jgi:hypothetical protein